MPETTDVRGVARDVARQYHAYVTGDAPDYDRRRVNAAIADMAERRLRERMAVPGRITTTRYDEKVVLTHPNRRDTADVGSFVLEVDGAALDAAHMDTDAFVDELAHVLVCLAGRVARDVEARIERERAMDATGVAATAGGGR